MPPDRHRMVKIVAVVTVLLLLISTSVLSWLYLGAMESEKERLAHLAILHVHQLEAMSQMVPGWEEGAVSEEVFAARIQQLFDSQKDQHHFGQTGEVMLVRHQEDGLIG
ncbi:MAG: hypothetical protein OEY80_12445, partial [Nitrospirota bacterium]|nr:hypothetical protein [Nitrospirota bacterium]